MTNPLDPDPDTSESIRTMGYLTGALVVILAFLQAAFTARNSDIWMHLSIGRLLINGQWQFGVDPFSYATVGMYWVNHAWLFGLVHYILYSVAGWLPVMLKAVMFALTILLVQQIRRASQQPWPSVIASALAVLACSPRLTLSPLVGSLLLLALTLYLIEQVRAAQSRRQLTVNLGLLVVVEAVWTNWDSWFFLGPLILALLTLGERLAKPNHANEPAKQLRRLGLAMALAVAATLINPHGLRVWTLPPELISPETIAMLRQDVLLRLSSMNAFDHWTNPAFGLNLCGLAYGLLLLLATTVMWLDRQRLRPGEALVLVVLGTLSVLHARLIPIFAIAAVPVISDHLASLVRSWQPNRFSYTASVATTLLGLTACVLAYPGLLHPEPPIPSHLRYHGYSIEPEAELVELARQLQSWRERGLLPAGWRGYHYHPDLIYYSAWFAPGEKGLLDYRYALFGSTLSDYVQIRTWLNNLPFEAEPSVPPAINKILHDRGIRYLVLTGLQRDYALPILQMLWRADRNWLMWYLDGNSAVLGRLDPESDPTERQRMTRLRLDLAKLAFGRDEVPLLKADLAGEPRSKPREWWEVFNGPPRPLSLYTSRAEILLTYADFLRDKLNGRLQACWLLNGARWVSGWPNPLGMAVDLFSPEVVIGLQDKADLQALPYLVVQAARKAICDNPNDAEAYFYLARAYELLSIGPNDPLRQTQYLWALRIGSERIRYSELPYRRPQLVLRGMESLINLYVRKGAKDLAHDITRKQLGYAEKIPDFADADLEILQTRYNEQKQQLEQARVELEQLRGNRPFTEQLELCLSLGLAREAIMLVRSLDFRDPNPALISRILELNLSVAGEVLRARELLRQTVGNARTYPLEWQVTFLVQRAQMEAILGEYGPAGSYLEESLALLTSNTPVLMFYPQLDLLPFHQQGRLLLAMMNQPQLLTNRRIALTNLQLLRGQIALEEGDIPVAIRHLREAAASRELGLTTIEPVVARTLLQQISNARE